MKLIYCPHCGDVVSLRITKRTCFCGKSSGIYKDTLNATVFGEAIPIGFENGSFLTALNNQPDTGVGYVFTAFVIPKYVETIKRKK